MIFSLLILNILLYLPSSIFIHPDRKKKILISTHWTEVNSSSNNFFTFNPLHAPVPFLYPLKISENQRFSDVSRGYRNGTLVWNGLKTFQSTGYFTKSKVLKEKKISERNRLSVVLSYTMFSKAILIYKRLLKTRSHISRSFFSQKPILDIWQDSKYATYLNATAHARCTKTT